MRVGLILCMLCGRLCHFVLVSLAFVGMSAPYHVYAQNAPAITSGPDDLSLQSGAPATFQVNVSGSSPIAYRWFFNETTSLSATSATLTVANVSLFNAGSYSVIASNAFGTATSRVARLAVDEHLTFRVLALRTNGFIAIEHSGVSSDDRGAIAVSSNNVFYTGDGGTARWNIDTLAGGIDIGRGADSLVTDLRTETLYSLGNGNTEIVFGGTITSLIELTPTGGLTGRRIDLSQPIPATTDFGQVGIFAGMGRVVIHNRTNAYSIAIPSGAVTDLGSTPMPFTPSSESWAFWGVAEYFNDAVHLLYVDWGTFPVRNIIRLSLPSGNITTVATFTNLSDMAVFTISPSLSRWFFHYEGNGQFRNGQETLGSAKALFTTDPGFPSIFRDPQSQTNYPGGTVTFSVGARGESLLYQWFFNGNPIAGATDATLVVDNITTQNAGNYTVQVSNDQGSALSGTATLTVFTTPIVRAGPFNRAVYPGQSAAFFALVDGAPPLSYQWRYNGAPIASGTNAILLLTNIQPSAAGLYSLRVTNIYGAAVSTNATLAVITSPFITAQPLSVAEFVGSNVTLVVTADGAPPLHYQWRLGSTPIPNATNRTLLLTNVQVADSGNYSVVITNQYGSVTSSNAIVTVLSELDDQGIFQITSLLTTGPRIVDHDALTGDDRGGIGITRDHVFVTGDNRTARFNAGDLTGGLQLPDPLIENLVTDLRTETVYRFADGTNLITFGTVTSLVEMNASGGLTGQRINLSRPIPINFFDTGIFAGYGRILVFNGERVFNIFMPSGLVRDLGLMSPFLHQGSEAWAFWGVAEHARGTNYLVYVEDQQRIVRRRVPDGEVSVVGNFTSLSDMASFVVSPSRRRWYFHYEGTAQFGGNAETLGYADATFNIRSGTGLDRFEWAPIGPVQVLNVPFPVRLTALNQSNRVVTNFSGAVSLSGLNVAGETPVAISPTVITNFVNGVWTGMVTARQASAAMFLRADDQVGVRTDSAVFSVSVTNDLVLAAVDSPDPVVVGAMLTYSILVTNIGPNPATAVRLTNTLATNLVFVDVTSTQGGCVNEGRIVRCDLGTIPGGAGVVIQVEMVPSAPGPTASPVLVTRGETDANAANNFISIATLVTQPAITIADVTITEGDTGTNDVTFSLKLTPATTNTVRVNFSTANGTAIGSGSTADYVPSSGTVTFAPGTTTQQVTVGIRGDRIFETDETFLVNLTAPVNGTIEDSQATATIQNDDAMPTVSVTDVTVTEQNTTTTNAIFRVSLSGGSGLPVLVTFATAGGTAQAGIDFSNRIGQLTFTAGTPFLTQNVAIIVYGDTTPEVNEGFFLNLTSATNAIIARAAGVGTIVNDDGIGQMHHFEWAAIPSPQAPNTPFPASITARDVGGLLATNFNSVAHLSALVPSSQPSNSILGSASQENTFTGDWTLGYSFTPAVEMRVTHVRHYFGNKISIWEDDGTLLSSTPVASVPGTWIVTPLPNEVILEPGNRYRIGAYTGGPLASYFWYTTGASSFPHGTILESHDSPGDSFPVNTDEVRWWLVDMLYTAINTTPAPYVTPTTVGPFVNGAWAGSLTVTQAQSGIRLRANDDGGHLGVSGAFDVASTAQFARIQWISGEVRLRIRGAMGRTYRIERADNLGNPSWQMVSQLQFDTPGEREVIDIPPAGNGTRFYRALLLP